MKHIGWCLDHIQMALLNMPKELDSDNDKAKAKKIVHQVQGYADTLVDIIHHPKFKKNINKLKDAPFAEIRMQANEVDELYKDLEHMLHVMDNTLQEYKEIINEYTEHDRERWHRSYDKLVLMIDQKFGGEKGMLRKEFEVSLHTKDELRDMIRSEEHLQEFLKY